MTPARVGLLAFLLAGCTDPGPQSGCGGPATPIHLIQGHAPASARRGEGHSIEAVATLRLDGADGSLLGTFVEAVAAERDPDPATSEGLLAAGVELEPGRRHALRGTVVELGDPERGLTALEVIEATDCGAATLPPAVAISLPADRHLEALEGMRVRVDGPLTVSGNYRLGSHAEMVVAAGGRLYQPTERTAPGDAARRAARADRRRSLVLDDTSLAADASALSWWTEPLGPSLPRAGDALAAVTGVIGDWDGYRLHLSAPVTRTHRQEPPAPPPRAGGLRVATFNLLNFFNGDGRGGRFPAARGAATPLEFERQKTKLVSALEALDAELYLLAELENDGSGEDSAVVELARALARATGRGYRAVPTPPGGLGDDAIAVGMIYDAASLALGAPAETVKGFPFDDLNRPPLLARFRPRDGGPEFSAVAVHFKSKGCNEASGENRDSGDGQSCWNPIRVAAARALADWIAALPGVEPDWTLIGGDFNAYTREDPLAVLTGRGYRRLATGDGPEYSFVYRGRAGALDHGFAGQRLSARLERAAAWHINADEAAWLDYRVLDKPPGDPLYAPTPRRSSDHDPLILDFDLR